MAGKSLRALKKRENNTVQSSWKRVQGEDIPWVSGKDEGLRSVRSNTEVRPERVAGRDLG